MTTKLHEPLRSTWDVYCHTCISVPHHSVPPLQQSNLWSCKTQPQTGSSRESMFLKRGHPKAGSIPRCSFPAAAFSVRQFKNVCLPYLHILDNVLVMWSPWTPSLLSSGKWIIGWSLRNKWHLVSVVGYLYSQKKWYSRRVQSGNLLASVLQLLSFKYRGETGACELECRRISVFKMLEGGL